MSLGRSGRVMTDECAYTLNLEQAARFLHLSPGTLRERAACGEVPAAKPGRRWVFLRDDLVAYLRGQYVSRGQAPL